MTTSEKLKILYESKKEHKKDLEKLEHKLEKIKKKLYLEIYHIESLSRTIEKLENGEDLKIEAKSEGYKD